MNTLFDENGNALETTVVTVYAFNENAEYIGFYDVRILSGTGIPGSTTLIAPPTLSDNHVAVFNGSSWEVVADYRGNKVYAIDTGVALVVDYLGSIHDGYTLIAPTTVYDRWNGKKWVTDTEAQQAAASQAAREAVRQELTSRLAAANTRIQPLSYAVDLNMATDEEKAALTEWQKYAVLLSRVDVNAGDIDWPPVPQK